MDTNDSNNVGSPRIESSGRKRDSNSITPDSTASHDEGQFKAPRRLTDEEPPPENDEARWRGDPKETYSDWKIEIVTPEKSQIYNVHKFILACGKRKSDYFSRLFAMESNFREGQSCTSRIELDPLAAQAFPHLLDYVYQYDQDLTITVETATALHHMGEYFEMQHLRYDAKQFCLEEMTVDNVNVFYTHATQFQNGSILDAVAEFLGENIMDVDPKTCAILNQPDHELWVNALHSVSQQDVEAGQKASKVVAQFVSNHKDTMDVAAFEKLTREVTLPWIHPNAALNLCRWEDRFHAKKPPGEGHEQEEVVTSLQERCATSLALLQLGQWVGFLNNPLKLWKLRQRRPAFLVDLICKVLNAARVNQKELVEEVANLRAILAKFQPICPSGRMVQMHESQFISVPEELQSERPDLPSMLRFGFQGAACVPTGDAPCLPAFFYDPTTSITIEEEGEQSDDDELAEW